MTLEFKDQAHYLGTILQQLLAVVGAFNITVPAWSQIAIPLSQGVDYRKARESLMAAGWQKVINFRPTSCSGKSLDRRCHLYLEFESCSQTGIGFCKAIWVDVRGRRLEVITAGRMLDGNPGNVVNWFFTDGNVR